MRIQHWPESIDLIPETDEEILLLLKLADVIGKVEGRILPAAQTDQYGTLSIFKF